MPAFATPSAAEFQEEPQQSAQAVQRAQRDDYLRPARQFAILHVKCERLQRDARARRAFRRDTPPICHFTTRGPAKMNRFYFRLLAGMLAFVTEARAVDPSVLLHQIAAPPVGIQSGALFGIGVATDGPYTVVGASLDDLLGNDSGVVKVFDTATGALLHVLPNPAPASYRFGSRVAISGTRVVVASPYYQGTFFYGRAYVYDVSGATPVLTHVINYPSGSTNTSAGVTVAISGTRIVLGNAYAYVGTYEVGNVSVYDISGTSVVLTHTLSNPTPAESDHFGSSVAISGTRVVVGASLDDTGASNAGSAYVFDIGGATALLTHTLNNPAPALGDIFGSEVAISGTRVVVGASLDDTSATDAGSAYVFDVAGASAVLTHTLNNPAPAANDYFGFSVAISGPRIVVGVYQDDTNATDAGSAYVFDVSGTNPVLTHTLDNPTPASGDRFGYSAAISGTRVVVGAYLDDTGATDAGSAYMFDISVPTAVLTHTLDNLTPTAGGNFGASVAVSGARMVVGAPLDDTGTTDAGSAYVYDISGAIPVLTHTLENPAPTTLDRFGTSVAISGTRVVVGAYLDDTGATDAGSAYVFDVSGTNPVLTHTLNNPAPAASDWFGYSAAISGTRVVVGAFQDDTSATDAGSAFVFDVSGAIPVLTHTLENPARTTLDRFGTSVAISGTRIVVGASLDDTGATNAGSAYVFDISKGNAALTHTLNNPVPLANDFFGNSVAIFGTRIVVGAQQDDTSATDAGSAYVFDVSGTNPVLTHTLNNPAPAANDIFGNSVAVSGTRVVVGAFRDDTSATDAGSAYVFDVSGTNPVLTHTLDNPTPAVGDGFGRSVSLDGRNVAIGIPFGDSPQGDNGFAVVYSVVAAPILEPPTLTGVTTSSVMVGSVVTTDGDATTTERGVVYSAMTVNNDPTLETGKKVTASGTTGVFTVDITGLSPHTDYTLKAYATNSIGTRYTNATTFTTLNTAPTAPASMTAGTTGDQETFAISLPATDADGDPLTITGAAALSGLTVDSFNGTSVTFTPATNFTGAGSFTYTVSDGITTAVGTVTVTVTDDDAPVVAAHESVGPIEATSANGAVATYGTASATDNVAVTSLNYSQKSGTTFPLGTTTVTIFAQDAAGNTGTRSFSVTVHDTTGPLVIPPANVTMEATSANGAAAIFGDATAIDTVGVTSISYSHPSGAIFPLGSTKVTALARDAAENEGMADFTVTVQDMTKPVINGTFTPLIVVEGTLPDFAALALASDNVGVVGATTQQPAAGSATTPGTVSVTLSAKDAAGNEGARNFDVIVRPAAPVNHKVLAQGDAAPGRVESADLPDEAVIASFGAPMIDDDGDLAFIAKWTIPTGVRGTGLFFNDKCLAVVGGDASAVGGAGARWKSFSDPVIEAGKLACVAKLSTGASAVVANLTGATLEKVAVTGEAAADMGDARFKRFTTVALRGGSLGFLAQIMGGTGADKVTRARDEGLWIHENDNALHNVYIESLHIGGGKKVASFVTFHPGIGSPGQGRGWLVHGASPSGDRGLALTLNTFTDRTKGIVISRFGGEAFLARSGDVGTNFAPALPGASFASFHVPAMNDALQNTFYATMKAGAGPVTKTNAGGIFASTADFGGSRAPYALIARVGGDAAQAGTGATFGQLSDPVLSADGDIAFTATVKGVKGLRARTLWWQQPGQPLKLLAQGGGDVGDIEGAKWKAFTSLAIAGGGRGPIFAATLVQNKSNVSAATATGVWATDFNGNIRTLFRTGDTIAGRRLKSFIVLNATVGNMGVTRSFNNSAQIVWLATFTDKSQAIVTTEVP